MPRHDRDRVALACLALVLLALGALGSFAGGDESDPAQRTLWALLTSQVLWVSIAFAAAVWLPGPAGLRLGLRKGRLHPIGWIIAIGGALLLSNAVDRFLIELGTRHSGSLGEIDQLVGAARDTVPWLAVLAIGIAPGVGEELLFRGLLQRSVARRLGSGLGVIVAAAVFGAVHFDPMHSPAAFVLGLYLGTVGVLAGNVWAPMLCHVANNLAAVSSGLWMNPLSGLEAWGDPIAQAGAACLLLAAAFWLRDGSREADDPASRL